jgi:hypothetical protein
VIPSARIQLGINRSGLLNLTAVINCRAASSQSYRQCPRNLLCRRASVEAGEAANWGGLTNTKTDDRKRLDPLGTCTSRWREQIRHELRSYLFGIPIDNL